MKDQYQTVYFALVFKAPALTWKMENVPCKMQQHKGIRALSSLKLHEMNTSATNCPPFMLKLSTQCSLRMYLLPSFPNLVTTSQPSSKRRSETLLTSIQHIFCKLLHFGERRLTLGLQRLSSVKFKSILFNINVCIRC